MKAKDNRERGADGNWVTRHSIIFTTVVRLDSRMYSCHAQNIAGVANHLYSAVVIPAERSTSWTLISIIAGSIMILLLAPFVLFLLRWRQKVANLILCHIYLG